MRVTTWFSRLALSLLACSVGSVAAMDIFVGGDVRIRSEDKQDFNFKEGDQKYWLSRLRAHAKGSFSEKSKFYFEFQHADIHGEDDNEFPPINPDQIGTNYRDEFDIYQLYYWHKTEQVEITFGRQVLELGDGRLVSEQKWENTGVVFDGLRLDSGEKGKREVSTFITAGVPNDPEEFNEPARTSNARASSNFHGIFITDYASLSGFNAGTLEYWYFIRKNEDTEDEVHTGGGRYFKSFRGWDFDFGGALQWGKFEGANHRAEMFFSGIERDVSNGRVGLRYSWGSGDDDVEDGTHRTFDSLYPSNQTTYGQMGLTSLQNLNDLHFFYNFNFRQNFQFRVAYHFYRLDYSADAFYDGDLNPRILRNISARAQRELGIDVDDEAGSELDLRMRYIVNKQFELEAGLSQFFTGNYLSATGTDDDADYIYFQSVYRF